MSVKRTLLLAAAVSAAPTLTCPSVGKTQLKNPGFEDSNTSVAPWTSFNAKISVGQPGDFSNNALKLTYPKSLVDPGFEQKIKTPCPGPYYFTYYYRFDRNGTADTSIIAGSAGGNFGWDIPTQSTQEWGQYSNFVNSQPINGSDLFQMTFFRPKEFQPAVFFDNFQFNSANFTVRPNARNLVANPGFEKGLTPWNVTFGAATVVKSGSGNALQITPDNDETTFSQRVKLTEGFTYRITYSYSYPKKTTADSFASLSMRIVGGRSSAYLGFDSVKKGNGTFTRDFQAYGEESDIQITVSYGLSDDSRWAPILIDNVDIRRTQ